MYIPGQVFIDINPERFGAWYLTYRGPSLFREGEWGSVFNLCREPIIMNSVLDLFSVSLLAVSHSLMLARSSLRLSSMLSTLLPASVKWVSWAYIRGWECMRQFGRSLIYKRKRSGPKIVPCMRDTTRQHTIARKRTI